MNAQEAKKLTQASLLPEHLEKIFESIEQTILEAANGGRFRADLSRMLKAATEYEDKIIRKRLEALGFKFGVCSFYDEISWR